MQADTRLRDYNAYRSAEAAPAPTSGPWLFEPFAENQDGHGTHRDHLSAGQHHGEQHQRPTRAGTPDPVAYAESKNIAIGGEAKRGKRGMSTGAIETVLLDR